MVESKVDYQFKANAENELFLSLVQPAWHSTLINKALNRQMSAEALIDIGDGNGIVNFWKKVDYHQKAEVLRRFLSEGDDAEKADPELWRVVTKSEPCHLNLLRNI